ncbi:hypothetical protein ACI8AA_01155 [Geodermatophilus sp. SYSU D01180]
MIVWLVLRAAMRGSRSTPPLTSSLGPYDGAAEHPGLTLPSDTLTLAVMARHPGERILARYPARIVAQDGRPVQLGELGLGSNRVH